MTGRARLRQWPAPADPPAHRHFLLAAGASLVQLDEPVLSEVVFTGEKNNRSFMCGALSEKGDAQTELAFAQRLIAEAVAGLPPSRLALHVCRGNWTRDERAALAGDYRALLPLLARVGVGTLFLELCTPRAGEIDVLKDLPASCRIGVGVVNQKLERVEMPEEIVAQARRRRGQAPAIARAAAILTGRAPGQSAARWQ